MKWRLSHNIAMLINSRLLTVKWRRNHPKRDFSFGIIQGKFTNTQLKSYNKNIYNISNTLYVLQKLYNEFLYFEDKEQANTSLKDIYSENKSVKQYNDGLCYYRIFIKSKTNYIDVSYEVRKNDYYKCIIDEILPIAHPKLDKDQVKPVNETSDIKMKLEVSHRYLMNTT